MALASNLISPTFGALTLTATIHNVLSGGTLFVSCSNVSMLTKRKVRRSGTRSLPLLCCLLVLWENAKENTAGDPLPRDLLWYVNFSVLSD